MTLDDLFLRGTSPGGDGWARPSETESLRIGSRIGPYQVIDLLGAGGMGKVYLAEQTEPVRRQVALKIIQAHHSRGSEARHYDLRFAAERQALARLSHPNIAQLYESGETEEGRPFFAMEFIEGPSITDYCDQRRLSVAARLEIFLHVCRGVEHAHQKGVLHRDLKPDNVLVCAGEGHATPKLIDFGVAKGIDEPLAAVTQLTQQGVVGTLAYVSPEAIRGAHGDADLDTRADVFALGVLLYELLVGTKPQDAIHATTAEALQKILSADLPAPSAHFISLDSQLRRRAAETRRSSADRLARQLRGDLDWIVLRATAQHRDDRYPSAGALAREIERHLRNEPVEAGPPALSYRARKFVIRHRPAVMAGALLLAALVLGVIGTTIGLVRAREQTEAARAAQRESDSVVEFVIDLFEASEPGQGRQDLEPVGEVLQRGADGLRVSLADQTAVRARLLMTVGRIFKELGNYPEADELLTESLHLYTELAAGAPTSQLVEASNELGRTQIALGRYSDAEKILRRAVDLQSQLPAEAGRSTDPLSNLANAVRELGRAEEAMELRRRIVERLEQQLPVDHQALATARGGLATDLAKLERREEAVRAYDLAIDRTRSHVDDPVLLGTLLLNASVQHGILGNSARKLELLQQSHVIFSDSLGADHPNTLAAAANLANELRRQNPAAAQILLLDLLPRLASAFGPDHPSVITMGQSLALTHLELGEMVEAAARFADLLERRLASEAPNLRQRLFIAAQLARAECALDRSERARAALEVMDAALTDLGEPRSVLGDSIAGCVESLSGRTAAAEATLRRALERFDSSAQTDLALRGQIQLGLGRVLLEQGRVDEARSHLSAARDALSTNLDPGHFWLRRLTALEQSHTTGPHVGESGS